MRDSWVYLSDIKAVKDILNVYQMQRNAQLEIPIMHNQQRGK